jgi:serine/threonine protein kinase
MGEVYKAKDTRLDRFVAIKVLPEQVAQSPEALARFEREAKAVAALNHPNVLGIFDIGHVRDTAYAVMELLEGESLRTRLEPATRSSSPPASKGRVRFSMGSISPDTGGSPSAAPVG